MKCPACFADQPCASQVCEHPERPRLSRPVPGDYIMERPLDFDTCPLCSSDSRARRQGVNGGICTDAWHNPDTETTMPDPTNEAEALAIVQRMVKVGCPTYRDNSGSLSRDGCAICIFCDANIELRADRDQPHAEDCLWLLAVEVARRADADV